MFMEDLSFFDLDTTAERQKAGSIAAKPDPDEEVYTACVLGLKDYMAKNHFKGVCLGLSGGIDSALVAAMAADAVGGANVHGISMPSMYRLMVRRMMLPIWRRILARIMMFSY